MTLEFTSIGEFILPYLILVDRAEHACRYYLDLNKANAAKAMRWELEYLTPRNSHRIEEF